MKQKKRNMQKPISYNLIPDIVDLKATIFYRKGREDEEKQQAKERDRENRLRETLADIHGISMYVAGIMRFASAPALQDEFKDLHYSQRFAALRQRLVDHLFEYGFEVPFPEDINWLPNILESVAALTGQIAVVSDRYELDRLLDSLRDFLPHLIQKWSTDYLAEVHTIGRPKLELDEIMLEASQWRSEQKALTGEDPTIQAIIQHCKQKFPNHEWVSDLTGYKTDHDKFRKKLRQYEKRQNFSPLRIAGIPCPEWYN